MKHRKGKEMRLIDADKLKEMRFSHGYNDNGEILVPMHEVIKAIDQAPTVDAGVEWRGHWILFKPRRTGRNATYKCSCCGKLRSSYYNDVQEWAYCPCGARMDGVQK